MKNNKKIIVASLLAMVGSSAFAQSSSKGDFEASASIESFCQINANDINFGVVILPLTAQSANAQMNVLCSNNTPYKVDLEYGGNYVGQSSIGTSDVQGVTATMSYKRKDELEQKDGRYQAGYRLFKDGAPIGQGKPLTNPSYDTMDFHLFDDGINSGDFYCTTNRIGQIFFYTTEAAKLVNNTTAINTWLTDKNGLCDTGRLNQSNFVKLFGGGSPSDKGLMIGTFKGDKLAYQITLPGDSSKPWIAGVNSYTSTGVGSNQVIDMNAKIVPSASSSSYIAADTYLDTVIATVSY